jgi:hypothetical protein
MSIESDDDLQIFTRSICIRLLLKGYWTSPQLEEMIGVFRVSGSAYYKWAKQEISKSGLRRTLNWSASFRRL